ncbi:ATP-binding protein [Roseomonas sp. CCTCC AB2023176]|uniref:sensor histidine kinase n=1 Tax=Roseomonas sp. CCTCC AB2023176 TaxID=3342640 RepID=UPI0035DD1CFA
MPTRPGNSLLARAMARVEQVQRPTGPARPGPIRLSDSAAFRIAVFFAVMFLAGGVAFSAVLWWNTAGALDRGVDAVIRADAIALTERFDTGGRLAVVEAIRDRIANDTESQTLYRLADREGRPLAGNLTRMPEELDGPEPAGPELRWFRMPLLREDDWTEARLYRADLANGDVLVVGRDVEERLRLRALLATGLGWGAVASAVLALLGALALRRALASRLRPATETAAAIAGGDLSQRVPMTGREDEFDRLGGTLNAMLDRIATLMTGIRGVSDAIAHDLRTPIARARGRLEESLVRDADAEALRHAVEQGIADLDGIIRVFQAVLRIAEAEAGGRRAFAPLDLVPLLEDAADLYGAIAEAKGIALRTDWPEALPAVGDRDMLLQAVANLLDNAVKFSPEGGAITLSAAVTGSRLRVTVADEGPGLSPADRARAADRFFRADSARATPGFGLGLSLVRAVAGMHDGELSLADARPGADPPGLAATLTLPAARA